MKRVNPILFAMAAVVFSTTSQAGELIAAVNPSLQGSEPADANVDVDAIRERYWARGESTELGVVQNRAYSKAGKIGVGLMGGVILSDPFLTVNQVGVELGYHLSETLSFNLYGWKNYVSPSTALMTFEDTLGATTNNNPPEGYLGGEIGYSPIYGKLSLVGESILYYDMHLLGGVGVTRTDSGDCLTPHLGIGQRFHISRLASLRVDYRLQYFKETIVEKVITPRLGEVIGTRDNFSNSITFGIDLLFDVFGAEKGREKQE